jgi:hypothetical protein
MMKNPPDDAELVHYSEEHLLHELTMLLQTADTLPKHKPGSTEYIAVLESFAIHLRNLLEFLFQPIGRDYVRALHFFDDAANWQPTNTAEWTNLYNRACHEVEHLTVHRVDGNPEEKKWPVTEILLKLDPILKDFASKASRSKLHHKVREFLQLPSDKMLLWIPENVSHSNIAVETFTGHTSVSASTATMIISVAPVKRT